MKVGGAVRIETRTTRRWNVDVVPVKRCQKRENVLLTQNEIETFPFLEKARYTSMTSGQPLCSAATGAFTLHRLCDGSASM